MPKLRAKGPESFSAQLAAEPGVLFTNTSLINTSLETRVVTLTALGEDGSPLGDSVVVQLGPGEQFDQDAGSLFIPAFSTLQGSSPVVGSLKVESDGPGVIGDVIFGDPLAFEFAAALPLQSQALSPRRLQPGRQHHRLFHRSGFFQSG